LGGADPAAVARDAAARIVHVHLKDVRRDIAAQLRTGLVTLVEATRRRLFCPLGDGDAPVADTLRALARNDYEGWYVIEQDTTLDEGALPDPGVGPAVDTRRSIEFLYALDPGPAQAPPAPGREVSGTR
jgi:inosose dehydratase